MRVDVIARQFGGPDGALNGMAMAAGFFACTLEKLGHQVRRLAAPDGWESDLIVTTVQPTLRRVLASAAGAGALGRLVYWHHAGGVPVGGGAILAAPPAIGPQDGWTRHVVLPPSSWAVEAGGIRVGSDVLVAGAGVAKGGHVALAVARLCPDLSWFVLRGRSSTEDRNLWSALPHSEVAEDVVSPNLFWKRARVVLSPTRFEVHPLLLVEAAVRGIPIVCTDLPATRCAAQESAIYVPMNAPPEQWVADLRDAIHRPLQRLYLRPYAEVVEEAITSMVDNRAAA